MLMLVPAAAGTRAALLACVECEFAKRCYAAAHVSVAGLPLS